jgi:hypothetical protein
VPLTHPLFAESLEATQARNENRWTLHITEVEEHGDRLATAAREAAQWESDVASARAAHAHAVQDATAAHSVVCAKLTTAWDAEREILEREHEERVATARRRHQEVAEETAAANKQKRSHHKKALEVGQCFPIFMTCVSPQ